MPRPRRGLSEVLGALILMIIVSSILASVLIVQEKFRRNIDHVVDGSAERLIEASMPPRIAVWSSGGRLMVSVSPTVDIDIDKIVVGFMNGSYTLVNATNDIYGRGQPVLDPYDCSPVRIAVTTSRGNIFYYINSTGGSVYTCPDSLELPGSWRILYAVGGKYSTITSASVGASIDIGADVGVYKRTCRLRLIVNGVQSMVTGTGGFKSGEAVTVDLSQGVSMSISPFTYVWNETCIAGLLLEYNKPSLVVASINLEGEAFTSTYNIVSAMLTTPLLASEYAASTSEMTINMSTTPGKASRGNVSINGNVYAEKFITLYISELNEYVDLTVSVGGTMYISRVLYIDGGSIYNITLPVGGPMIYKQLVPEPHGDTRLNILLTRLYWTLSHLNNTLLELVTPDGRVLERSVISEGYVPSRLQGARLIVYPSIAKVLETYINYARINSDSNVTFRASATPGIAIPPKPVLLQVETSNYKLLVVASTGHRDPVTGNTSIVIIEGGSSLSGGLLVLYKTTPRMERIELHDYKFGSRIEVDPGTYIAAEIEWVQGILVGESLVILSP